MRQGSAARILSLSEASSFFMIASDSTHSSVSRPHIYVGIRLGVENQSMVGAVVVYGAGSLTTQGSERELSSAQPPPSRNVFAWDKNLKIG